MFEGDMPEWDIFKENAIIKQTGFTKEEWTALQNAFGGAGHKDEIQEHMISNPEHAQLVFAGYDRMGYGYCLFGMIVHAAGVGLEMSKIRRWAEEVGVTLNTVVGQ
jgi:hypothetical protein